VAWFLGAWHAERIFSVTSLATPHGKAFLRSMVSSTQLLHSWYMIFFQLPWLPELGLTGPGQRLSRRTLRRSGLPDSYIERYLSVLAEPGAASGAINWYRALPLLPPSRSAPVGVPTLYVYGTSDFALGRKAADLTGRYVTGPYRYEVLEGVSHWLPEEVPETVAALVIEHVRRYGAKRS
jgi:pimeloyl-ACP methyl ester carboxylesterase